MRRTLALTGACGRRRNARRASDHTDRGVRRRCTPTPKNADQENAAWIFGARPAAVIGGGLLLLLLAAALLAVGQRDDTGTIVMLSFCAAPLGLLVLLIGIARYIAGATRRG